MSAATAFVLALIALLLAACGSDIPPRGMISDNPNLALPPLPASAEAEADEQVADPVRVRIPAIGVDAPVGPLEVDETSVLPPPDTDEGTGWWRAGPEPGERGPAVIVGHVDSYQGPAVFVRLHEMQAGQEILVDRADGTTATFVATRVERHDKDAFPTEAVYDDTPDPQLRLVTCGGDFDRQDRRYLDNIIIYAARTA